MPTRPARMRHHRRNAVGALALTATLILATAACSDDKNEGPTADATTTTTSKVATSTTVKPEQLPSGHFIDLRLPAGLTAEEKEVAGAYRDATEAFARAQRDPEGSSVALDQHLSGPALQDARSRLTRLAADHQAARQGSGKSQIVVILVEITDPTRAVMRVCLHDDTVVYRTTTGKTVTASTPDAEAAYELVRSDHRWRVKQSEAGGNRPADKPCAA